MGLSTVLFQAELVYFVGMGIVCCSGAAVFYFLQWRDLSAKADEQRK